MTKKLEKIDTISISRKEALILAQIMETMPINKQCMGNNLALRHGDGFVVLTKAVLKYLEKLHKTGTRPEWENTVSKLYKFLKKNTITIS